MALVKCKECGNQVSTKAEVCPGCGAKVRRKSRWILWFLLPAFVWVIVSSVTRMQDHKEVSVNNPKSSQAKEPEAIEPPVQPVTRWESTEYSDPMTDETVKVLSLKSTNSALFDFPYKVEGGSYLRLVIRKRASGYDALFVVDRGQIQCHYRDCSIEVRVDGGKVQRWPGSKSTTNESNLIFINSDKKLITILGKAKSIRVGIQFYRSGLRSFDFDLTDYPGF